MKKTLDPTLQREAEALAALPDDTIAVTDIPELPAAAWDEARRPGLLGQQRAVTLKLDSDVIGWFEDHVANGGIHAEINRVLRRHVAEAERRSA